VIHLTLLRHEADTILYMVDQLLCIPGGCLDEDEQAVVEKMLAHYGGQYESQD